MIIPIFMQYLIIIFGGLHGLNDGVEYYRIRPHTYSLIFIMM